MISKEHVLEWMDHPVTEELRKAIKERIEEATELILSSNDPDLDRLIKGLVKGYNDVLDWQPEVVDAEVQREVTGSSDSY